MDKQISISTRIVATETNKDVVKNLVSELARVGAIDLSDAEVILAGADCL